MVIKSVIGFNFNIEIKDQYGNKIKTGTKTVKNFDIPANPVIKLNNNKFFTSFNKNLLDQIINLRQC